MSLILLLFLSAFQPPVPNCRPAERLRVCPQGGLLAGAVIHWGPV